MLTLKEKKRWQKLGRKWACGKASMKEMLEAMELKRKEGEYNASKS